MTETGWLQLPLWDGPQWHQYCRPSHWSNASVILAKIKTYRCKFQKNQGKVMQFITYNFWRLLKTSNFHHFVACQHIHTGWPGLVQLAVQLNIFILISLTRLAGNPEYSWKLTAAVEGREAADFNFQQTSVLPAIFKWCTHCTTCNNNVRWKLKSAASQPPLISTWPQIVSHF